LAFICSTVLQLCYNQLTGSIPTQLGSLQKLSVIALQSNQLTGAIPASLGDLEMLSRLDLSFNHLFGSVPSKLADAPLLEVVDLRNNTLSGSVPAGKVCHYNSRYFFFWLLYVRFDLLGKRPQFDLVFTMFICSFEETE